MKETDLERRDGDLDGQMDGLTDEARRFGEARLGETEICRDGDLDRLDIEETQPWRDRDLERRRFGEVKHRGDTDLERQRPGETEVWTGERQPYKRDFSRGTQSHSSATSMARCHAKAALLCPHLVCPPPLVPCFCMLELL